LYELGLHDSEAPIILHGIVCQCDFSQVLIMVTNTGTENFALADIGRLTFTVELLFSIACLCEEAALTISRCCVATSSSIHVVKNSPTGTDDEEESHGGDFGEDMEEA
jgi:hypothetical protein